MTAETNKAGPDVAGTDARQGLLAKCLDLRTGGPEVFLTPDDARRLGLRAHDRAAVRGAGGEARAAVNVWKGFLPVGQAGLSQELCDRIGAPTHVTVRRSTRPESVGIVRRKLDGERLTADEIRHVISDIASGTLTPIELTAWACGMQVHGMDQDETVACIKAMVGTGGRISFDVGPVVDVHSIGGVPGNKYAPIAVSIVAEHGIRIPKTSSRAITSACGTADFMEVLCPVEHDAKAIHDITERVGGTLAWGGGVSLAPADDAIIRVEYPLGLDPHSQLLASVLSKKLAVGAQKVLIDIPVGPGAKVASEADARSLARDFIATGSRLGLDVQVVVSQGDRPLGQCIGPALEAREALATLAGGGSDAVRDKGCTLAGRLLEMADVCSPGDGAQLAQETVKSGRALSRFRAILAAQGGNPDVQPDDIRIGASSVDVRAPRSAVITAVDIRALVQIARATGSPHDAGAGILTHVRPGDAVEEDQVLYTLYAHHDEAAAEAKQLARQLRPYHLMGGEVLDVVT